ncbi:MAG: peptide deformylase [Planctomycetes bacterium]|jgi:peptide deformylase|nr:peptide deformylase [Planctomycetota bacterium]|tara:strand:- start:6531 stop:7085 length:555 start_codon:yes stop_codon:yes gene_type:complete
MDKFVLLPPSDPRVLSSIAPFDINEFKKIEKIELKEFVDNMFDTTKLYGGIGLSANQVGKPYRMFIMGHPEIHNNKRWTCINPRIVEASKQTTRLKEGCLTFPFLFLDIERPSAVKVKYFDEELKEQEEDMIGIVARCFQHELDHMNGIIFTEKVSKFKLNYAMKKRDKEIRKVQKRWKKYAKN